MKLYKLILALLLFPVCVSAQNDTSYFTKPIVLELFDNDMYELAAPFLSHDQSRIYFTVSDREKLSKSGELLHEIWYADIVEGSFMKPTRAEKPFNNGYNTAIVGSSKNGERLYLFGSTNKYFENEKGLSYTWQEKGIWQKPVPVQIPNLTVNGGFYAFYVHPSEDAVLISMDSNGQEDIFLSALDKRTNTWTVPYKLPRQINTDALEISPYLSNDKKTLYFSRINKDGSAQVFYSERLNNSFHSWSTAKPLPAPINGKHFDAYFSLLNDGSALFSSTRSGIGELYYSEKITEEIISLPEPLIIDLATEIDFIEPKDQIELIIDTEKKQYLFYDFNSTNVHAVYASMLDQIIEKLTLESKLKINLRGHADFIDTEDFNESLSYKRAEKVGQYLIENGIASQRITIKGYGELLPISTNNTPEGRRLNRRVEIEIVNNAEFQTKAKTVSTSKEDQ